MANVGAVLGLLDGLLGVTLHIGDGLVRRLSLASDGICALWPSQVGQCLSSAGDWVSEGSPGDGPITPALRLVFGLGSCQDGLSNRPGLASAQ